MRSFPNYLLACAVGLLSINAVMTASLPTQLSSVSQGYSFEPDALADNNIETASLDLTRPILNDAVMTSGKPILCVEKKRGAALHRICEHRADDESFQSDPGLSDRFAKNPNPVRRPVELPVRFQARAVLAAYTMERWDDLALPH